MKLSDIRLRQYCPFTSLTAGNLTPPLRRMPPAAGALIRLPLTVISAVLLFVFISLSAYASDQSINKNWRSIAIKGYDPVAYFTMRSAVEGKKQFEHTWQDARWRFVSQEHLDLFAADPALYAPQFGGYCAQGMKLGRKASIDPHAWLIVDGELFLNYSVDARDAMASNPKPIIEEADLVWDRLKPLLEGR